MYSSRLLHLLTVALTVSSVTGVAWLDNRDVSQGQLAVRQDDDSPISIGTIGSGSDSDDATTTDAGSAATPTSTDEATSSTAAPDSSTTETPSSTEETSTAAPTSTEDTASPTSTEATPTSTDNGGTTAEPTSTTTTNNNQTPTSTAAPTSTSTGGNGGGNSNSNTSTGSETSEAPSTTLAPVTSTFVTIITTTDSAGSLVTSSSSSTVVSTPTAVADDNSNTNSGITPGTKNTIIGVCVGVGGAIVLAAAGVLFWRLRSSRRNHEENEELVSYGDGFGGPGTAEKTEPTGSQSGRSPFQSTLESYHAPTSTNAASNF
ncbi:hypothetical protein M426DRAFT_22543 [Hypoxylon sp. CI-4A]|nr:hypothetical protein M426DRAFT_22543 [Hypoxylon sp. CI-4A]